MSVGIDVVFSIVVGIDIVVFTTKDSKFNATCCVLIVGIGLVFFMTKDFQFNTIRCDCWCWFDG